MITMFEQQQLTLDTVLNDEDRRAYEDVAKAFDAELDTMHPEIRHMARRMARDGNIRKATPERDTEVIICTLQRLIEFWSEQFICMDPKYIRSGMLHRCMEALQELTARRRIDWYQIVQYTKYRIDYENGKIISITFISEDEVDEYVHEIDKYMAKCTRVITAYAKRTVADVFCEVRFRTSRFNVPCLDAFVQFKLRT